MMRSSAFSGMSENTSSSRSGRRSAHSSWKRAKSWVTGHRSSLKQTDGEPTGGQTRATAVCAPADAGVSTLVQIVVPHKRVAFGERVAVVGHSEALGCWQASNGLLLEWAEGDIWSTEVALPAGLHEFKCLTVKPDGQAEWEAGGNRVVQVPADVSGGVELRCEWSNTATTLITATPAGSTAGDTPAAPSPGAAAAAAAAAMRAAGGPDEDLAVEDGFYSCTSLTSSQASDLGSPAMQQLAAMPLITSPVAPGSWPPPPQQQQQQGASGAAAAAGSGPDLDLQDAPPSGPGSTVMMRDISSSSTSSEAAYGALQQQRPPPAVLGTFANSSEDMSMFNYQPGTSSSSPSVSLSPEPSFTAKAAAANASGSSPGNTAAGKPPLQQQRLTPSSLAAAAKAAAGQPAVPPAGAGSDAASDEGEGDRLSLSPSTFSGFTVSGGRSALTSPAASSSRAGVLRGVPSSSTLSLATSMDVSEVVLDDGSAMLSEADAAALSVGLPDSAAAAAMRGGGSSSSGYLPMPGTAADAEAAAATAAAAAAQGLDIDLEDPAAFESLMAVDPSVLQLQQQQQQQPSGPLQVPSDMLQMSAFAAAATAEGASPDELLEAAAQLFALAAGGAAGAGGAVSVVPTADGGTGLLLNEDTLPPEALTRFKSLPEQQQQQQQQQDAASSRLSKDQLPCLGLTVTVPTPADKAAQAAAQLSAATREAAAVKLAAGAPARLSSDGGSVEVPVATEGLRLVSAAHIVPHVDKAHTGGEDAFFISPAGHGSLGVSDGVSAWAEDGIDPGEYSRTLVQYCAEAVEERAITAARAANKGSYSAKFDPRAVLRYAQQCTCKPGSATVVLAALQPGGKLHVANLGDCGVKVVRGGRVVHETTPQQHDFNLPYQLSHPRLFPDTDTADSADRYTWDVQEGDVIVAASDGLFDNLWDDEMLELLQQGLLGLPPRLPDPSESLGRAAGKKMSRSRSFAALSRSLTGGGSSSGLGSAGGSSGSLTGLPSAASAPAPGAAGSSGGGLPRSRSTSHISSWGAKQLWHWKGKGAAAGAGASASHAKSPAALPAGAGGYGCVAEEGEPAVGDEQPVVPGDAAAAEAPVVTSPADVSPAAVSKAAELLAAAAAAHAADKEFKSPWSVAAGKAYGLLARLFAKGGKMDDITCVVAVVQDAQKAAAAGVRCSPPCTIAAGGPGRS